MGEPSSQTPTILAVDPGRTKCGIAVVHATNPPSTAFKSIVETGALLVEMAQIMRRFPQISALVIGNGTESRTLLKAIAEMFPNFPVSLIDEHGSSQRARLKYLQEHPASGWHRLLPIGLRTPDRPYDDTVAELLAQDFLDTSKKTCNNIG